MKKKRDKVDRIIGDHMMNFTHLWVNGFGWETTIFLPSDFDKVIKFPIKDKSESQIFYAYNFEDDKVVVQKFKGNCKS